MNTSSASVPGVARGFKRLRGLVAGVGAALLAACGAGGGSSMGGSPTVTPQSCTGSCGGALVTLTDAAGDFDSYIVKIVSLQLTRADGTFVETLPVTTQVDFTQLVNLSEIISAAQIPAGKYVSAKLTLDYAGATIVVDNGAAGVTIAAGNILNGATANAATNTAALPLAAPNPTQVTLTLQLANDAALIVTPGTIAHLALDFNLAASPPPLPPLAGAGVAGQAAGGGRRSPASPQRGGAPCGGACGGMWGHVCVVCVVCVVCDVCVC